MKGEIVPFSIVVPVKNDYARLRQWLDALELQYSFAAEVVIVENDPESECPDGVGSVCDWLEHYRGKTDIRWICHTGHIADAMNAGANAALYSHVYFSSVSDVLDPNLARYVARKLDVAKNSRCPLLLGSRWVDDRTGAEWSRHVDQSGYRAPAAFYNGRPFVASHSMLFERDWIVRNPFDKELHWHCDHKATHDYICQRGVVCEPELAVTVRVHNDSYSNRGMSSSTQRDVLAKLASWYVTLDARYARRGMAHTTLGRPMLRAMEALGYSPSKEERSAATMASIARAIRMHAPAPVVRMLVKAFA